jgi:subtilisin family serine protease
LKGDPAASMGQSQTIPDKFAGVLNSVKNNTRNSARNNTRNNTRNSTRNSTKYNPNSTASKVYRQKLRNQRVNVMSNAGIAKATYEYEHAFNGFAAQLSDTQLSKLKSNPNVLSVWPEELYKMDTANTPSFLGLTAPGGLHTNGNKGEDVIIGIVDSGVWPENPSLDDTDFMPIAVTRPDWAGECDTGTDPDFSCNNKLIGARYFNASFLQNNSLLPGEFSSPRDADGHGTHTLTTAGGNEGVEGNLFGASTGILSGMAPRARVAAYKVCWNGSDEGNSGCSSVDSVAAIDAAVADGVDVINFSISGSRTSSTDPVHIAFFNASKGGVFSANSAGNSGPDPETVAHNVPWVTTVGASTYDGTSLINVLKVTSREPQTAIEFAEGPITKALALTGSIEGELVIAEPLQGCFVDAVSAPLDNAGDIQGNIALIQRGTCAFTEKVERAELAGASAVIIYSDGRPLTGLGGNGSYDIAGVMISTEDGEELMTSVEGGEAVTVNLGPDLFIDQTEVGNQMAGFSSRGPSLAIDDIIKPDITAPGVRILAGTSGAQIDNGVMGESYKYLSGTSMSSPHIAGLAALIRETHPAWSPAAMKSAMMTSARQNVSKEDGSTPADLFDYGAGHVVPNSMVEPGLVYDISTNDYYAYLCGAGESDFVDGDFFPGACAELQNANFSLDPSDLNLASVAISELGFPQSILRVVTNVSDNDSTYIASMQTPAGVDAELRVYNLDAGEWEVTNAMTIAPGAKAYYQVGFSQGAGVVLDQWQFGSLTWDDGVHAVRTPIAIKSVLPPRVVAPAQVQSVATQSATRTTLSVQTNYSGRFYATGIGMDSSDVLTDTVEQDPDSTFAFNEAGLGFFLVDVPQGTRITKFALRDKDMPIAGIDLDLYVYACPTFSTCAPVGTSAAGGTDESVVLIDPQPLQLANDATYLVFVHGWSLAGLESVTAPLHVWNVDESAATNMAVRTRSRARDGNTNKVYVGMYKLQHDQDYLGGVIYTDENGDENGMTVLEVETDF